MSVGVPRTTVSRAVAINVAANTNLPGRRGPVYGDGSFVYVPIPEREPTADPVPTYADLGLAEYVPADAADLPVHRDPEFVGVHGGDRYTYGDPYDVKAGPLSQLGPGDLLLFYATLSVRADPDAAEWLPPEWGAFLIGLFEVAEAVTGDAYRDLPTEERERFASNAHLRREAFDAAVVVRGTDDSRLFDRAVPLSTPAAGAEANRLVTDLSNDSGRGPWWRRVLRYDESATADLRGFLDRNPAEWLGAER